MTEALIKLGNDFAGFYYANFGNRTALSALYQDHSMLTWEGSPFQGVKNIMDKFESMGMVQCVPTTIDVQPTVGPAGQTASLVFVCGTLALGGEVDKPMKFCHIFNLFPTANGGLYVFNEIFRLNIG